MPIQQMLLGVGAKKKTYMDDVFSTFLYKGNADDSGSSSQSINNGINLSGEGGMTWIKWRGGTYSHSLFDTVRGNTKRLASNGSGGENTWTDGITSFNNNGFTLGSSAQVNYENLDFASWTFRKAPGFFDVVKFTAENSSNQRVSHSLGCIPGLIIVKNISGTQSWFAYHRDTGKDKYLKLNDTSTTSTVSDCWGPSGPTATDFGFKSTSFFNTTSGEEDEVIAYLFAGGESAAATARSVAFNGSSDWIHNNSSSSDFTMGTGDFTIECWAKMTASSSNNGVCHLSDNATGLSTSNPHEDLGIFQNSDVWKCWAGGWTNATNIKPVVGVWTHLALVRHSGKTTLYVNGVQGFAPITDNNNYDGTYIAIGGYYDDNYLFEGRISNFRVVKGTAVYTSSFRPPTQPLTNITNTKLLCCNNSSVTGSTVTPSTLNGESSTASTDSPFDDPDGFTFGENEDQGIINCGSYIGNGQGSSGMPEMNLGWEPQWVLVKSSTYASTNWNIFDSLRGIQTNIAYPFTTEPVLTANSSSSELNENWLEVMPTGFKTQDSDNNMNRSGETYIYMAIRRPDGYVGKPAEAGTDVFAMDTGNSSSTEAFTSGFPVDYVLSTNPSSTSEYNWETGARLTQGKYLYTHSSAVEAVHANFDFTSNTGWSKNSGYNSTYQAWMWKRHAGFDVVTYKGDAQTNRQIPHSLSKIPEMIWTKDRAYANGWAVYHKGLNGGTNPEQYNLMLDENSAEVDSNTRWNDTAPTSTYFTVGNSGYVNRSGDGYIALLFASVDGISKVGYYTGDGSTDGSNVITTGFAPRLLIIKRVDAASDWCLYDTLRAPSFSGADKYLHLNNTNAQDSTSGDDPLNQLSTGFSFNLGYQNVNGNGSKYIYYAHA